MTTKNNTSPSLNQPLKTPSLPHDKYSRPNFEGMNLILILESSFTYHQLPHSPTTAEDGEPSSIGGKAAKNWPTIPYPHGRANALASL